MPHPTSQARASRALRRAISLTPTSHPLRQSLQVLSNPLTHRSSHTHLDESVWQAALNHLTTFADRVIQTLNSHLDDNTLTSLHNDAVQLHHKLDSKGFHTAFYPSHVSARSLSALRTCADPSEHTEANMRVVSTSLPATYQCLQQIFDTPVTLVDPIGTLNNVADNHRYITPPPSSATVPSVDTSQLSSLQSSYNTFINRLNRAPIPDPGRERVRAFVDLFWHQYIISDAMLTVEKNPTTLPQCDHLSATDYSLLVNAVLHLSEDSSPGSPTLWSTRVVLKTLRALPDAEHKLLAVRQETLRLKALSHPCLPVFYGAIWPPSADQHTLGRNLHLVSERMTKSVRLARQDPALRAFEVRMQILRDVADALRFLHAQQVFHGSISPENVLIRICDGRIYGRAKVDVTCLATRALIGDSQKHPLVYRSPESFSTKKQFFTSDVWSLAVLACFLFGDKGDEENNTSFVRMAVARRNVGSVAQEWAKRIADNRARDLVMRCLHLQPERRPNAEDVFVDISEIFRQKSVKADVLTPAVSPARDCPHGTTRDCREPTEDSQVNHRDILYRSESDHGVLSLVNGKIPTTARKTASGSRQEYNLNTSTLKLNRNESSNVPTPCEVSRDEDDEGYGSCGLELSDDTGLNDILKFQADGSGEARCVKRKAAHDTSLRPTKRPKVDQVQDEARETLEVTAGLREATMEEIFGPFSSTGFVSGLCKKRAKSEDVLANDSPSTKECGVLAGSVSNTKVEETLCNIRESNNVTDPSHQMPEENTNTSAPGEQAALAKAEPVLEAIMSDGTATADASPRNIPTTIKRKDGRQRVARKDRRRSRSGGADNGNAAYKPKQVVEPPLSTSWKGRIRKRIRRPMKYVDRSPSPAPSSSSHGDGSNASNPSENVFHIESSNSLGQGHKDLKGNTKSDKQATDSLKKKKDIASVAQSEPRAKHCNGQVDVSLDFVKGAKEGESLLDFLDRQAKKGNTTALVRIGVLYEEGRHVKCDYGSAFLFYRKAAAAGNSEGQLRLARCYEDGRGVSKNEPAAAALFIQAADADNARAQFRAGVCFEEGRGVVQNLDKALHYLNKSAEQRDPESCHKVAGFCREGKGMRKDEARAFELYKVASDAGFVPSMVQLANMYAKGIGGAKRSITKAVTLYRQASDAGNPDAKLSLGLLHEDGQGVKKSSECALRLYKEAASLGHAPAMTALGQCFLWGYGVEQNFHDAVHLFRSAAKQGDSLALHELGNCYKEGSGVEQNYPKALHFYKKASAQGSSVALVQYGEFLYSGLGVSQDYDKAFEQFRRAANLGAAEGYRWLGECYADGTGAKKDLKKAFQMYQKGADLGSSYAQTCLGVCYENGTGVDQSKTKAIHWYRKAAAEGNHTAMNNLGIFYEQGRMVKRDPKRAVSYYQKAIDLGSVDAICNLADCYASGNGITRDLKMAVHHYQDAANQGMSGAKCELGICYYYGRGVRQNFEKAMDLFKEASGSEPEALRHLGTGFYDGNGVERDYIAAVRLYRKAISQGNVDANLNLAFCYSYGKGVPQDEGTAVSLLEAAAAKGNRYAKLTLGNSYFDGRGVDRNLERAVTLFSEAGDIDFSQPLIDDRIMSDEPQIAGRQSSCS